MRGLPGLLIAVGLGIVGAICNWYYLSRQAAQMEKVAFVALNGDAQLNLGDRFADDHFMQVQLPSNNLGNLQEGWHPVARQSVRHWVGRDESISGKRNLAMAGSANPQ